VLSVEGEPGVLPSGVELGLYRIIEDAVTTAPRQPDVPVEVSVTFGDSELEVRIGTYGRSGRSWPTPIMLERATACDGDLQADHNRKGHHQLTIRLPRALRGALA